MPVPLTFLIGCTGCGKGSVGRELARHFGAEIISIDSMKVYRRMDIGTAKPSPEIRRVVPHHLLDVAEPWEEFSVARYVRLAEGAIADIHRRGKPVLLVGGTPLYIKALTEGLFEGPSAEPALRSRLLDVVAVEGSPALHRRLERVDPVGAARIHPNDVRRLVRALEVFELTGKPITAFQQQWGASSSRYQCLFIGLRRSREDQSRRTNERVRKMIAEGWVEEVRRLREEPLPLSASARKALGYAEIMRYLDGETDLAGAVESVKISTRRFSKAQRTWFKRFHGAEWIDLGPEDAADSATERIVSVISHRVPSWSR